MQPVPARSSPPPLENGDRLTRAEFERRYRAMPHKKAELIEGVVHLTSPVRATKHGQPHAILMNWLGHYVAKTPGLLIFDNTTDRLDEDNEPQPDAMLLIPPHAGGNATIDEDDYVNGAPEFVAEVAASSVSIDMHTKLHVYRRNGVREYLAWRVDDAALDWFILIEGVYEPLGPDPADGLFKSRMFAGLWLDAAALLAHDLPRLFAAVERGCATDDHAAFVKRLAQTNV